MLLTTYSCGLRRSELCRLKVSNVDSQRMLIRIERGKGGVDREIPLNQKLLETWRTYWRWMRPKTKRDEKERMGKSAKPRSEPGRTTSIVQSERRHNILYNAK